ncbi:Protein N-terminal and lysine N-methyltransferase efm7 [Stygiomarasmius scandens]|uniref:Protein N-terminal and lysine N-methyltransferase EFM7 n=1 Tax=Marasmiellus scandens TaxID=2682957 RepID=A0ABR1JTP2_9AGAR
MSDTEADLGLDSVFPEPPRPPTPEPTVSTYTRENAREKDLEDVRIRLVGNHPLWGHYLWNSALCISSYLDEHPELCKDRFVLELGAGGGLPSIIAALNNAKKVVLTDYPDASLIENMQYNVDQNIQRPEIRSNVHVEGYIWGHSVQPLLDILPNESISNKRGYHLIILSDLVFNHSQHDSLLKTCELALAGNDSTRDAPEPCVLVFYTHHRPHLAHRDMEFFEKAKSKGWVCDEIVVRKYPPMFPDDPGAEEVRSTVHGWKLTRSSAV